MSDPKKFRVEREDEDFKAELASFEKQYYKRKRKLLESFQALLEDIFSSLEANPRNTNPPFRRIRARLAHWPKGLQQEEHLEFWKLTFPVPGYAGESGEGRLMYLINLRRNLVLPLLIYTHKTHTKRPPDHEIKDKLRQFMDESDKEG